ncbi:SDR family oxidoreductase [Falsiroseomonas algicola]|nr:SDR family oxidoreductase [Falsiroseomonas algicola]
MLVTGASRGIGAAVARLAAARGHDLVLTWRGGGSAMADTVAACEAAGAAVEAVVADAGSAADTARAFAACDARFGRIDAFVGNAGITGPAGDFLSSTDETWEAVFRVNVVGLASACREALRRMATSRGGKGGGIVLVSSRAAQIGSAFEWVHYAASKGAVDTMVLGLAREMAGEGVRVNAVAPGMIDTDIHAEIPGRIERILPGVPMKRMGTAEEVAEAVLYLLSPAASYVTGAVLPIGGGR